MGRRCGEGALSYAKSGAARSEGEGLAASASWSVGAIHGVDLMGTWSRGMAVKIGIGVSKLCGLCVLDFEDCDPGDGKSLRI